MTRIRSTILQEICNTFKNPSHKKGGEARKVWMGSGWGRRSKSQNETLEQAFPLHPKAAPTPSRHVGSSGQGSSPLLGTAESPIILIDFLKHRKRK